MKRKYPRSLTARQFAERRSKCRQRGILIGQEDALLAQYAEIFELLIEIRRIGVGKAQIPRVAALIRDTDRNRENLRLFRIGRNSRRYLAQREPERPRFAARIAGRDDCINAVFFKHAFEAAVERISAIVDMVLLG